MKHNSMTVLFLSLLLMLFISACGNERIVYVVVTATPETNTANAAAEGNTEEELPAVLQVDESSEANAPAATAEPVAEATSVPVETQAEEAAEAQPSGSTNEPSDDERAVEGALPPTLSGKAERIAFMGPFGQSSTLQAYVVNIDGTGLTALSEELGEGYFPSLSSDGNQVLFVSNTSIDPEIYLFDIPTTQLSNLSNQPGFDNQPLWSPDSKQIAFLSDRDGGDTDIWVMNADGSSPRRLAKNPGEESMGGWSPDGKKLVYSNRDEVGEALWIIDVESGESTRLTESQAGKSDTSPAWSPDGKTIAYHSSENNTPPMIWTMNIDGSQLTQITNGEVPAVFPAWGPDGQSLIYTEVVGERRNMVAHDLTTQARDIVPNVQGFANSWQAAGQLLAETGYTQGPKLSGVEVSPAILEAAYRIGSPDAPVKIIEFSDYQCPFCQRWFNDVYIQLKPYFDDGTAQLIFVDFPLHIHPEAPIAAQAARCGGQIAGDEGYWLMHDAIFNSMNQWSGNANHMQVFNELATGVGLDGNAVQQCIESGQFAAEVDAGLQEGVKLGVTGTPTFFINGNRLVGAQPWEVFEQYLNQGG